jgi:hypothetical protein
MSNPFLKIAIGVPIGTLMTISALSTALPAVAAKPATTVTPVVSTPVVSTSPAAPLPLPTGLTKSFAATGTNTYDGSNDPLGASVLFNYVNNILAVTLTNTSALGISNPSDVLTSVFWDYGGTPLNLSFNSATAPTVVGASAGSNVDLKTIQEWRYAANSAGLGGDVSTGGTAVTQKYGLGTAGLGIFGGGAGGQQFNYGIITGLASDANNAVKAGTFVKNSATFQFTGLAADFDVTKISNVRFQYGTSLKETTLVVADTPPPPPKPRKVPEPATATALLLAGWGMLRSRKQPKLAS